MTDHMDDERLVPLVEKIGDTESKNAESFDKAILTLASGALGLSLSFTKEIVEPQQALANWLLFLSWGGFLFAIVLTVLSYLVTIRGSFRERELAIAVLRHRQGEDEDLQSLMESNRNNVLGFATAQAVFFLAGVVAYAIYIGINFYSETAMTNRKVTSAPMNKAIPSTAFVSGPIVANDAQPSAAFLAMKPATVPTLKPASTAPQATAPVAQTPVGNSVKPK